MELKLFFGQVCIAFKQWSHVTFPNCVEAELLSAEYIPILNVNQFEELTLLPTGLYVKHAVWMQIYFCHGMLLSRRITWALKLPKKHRTNDWTGRRSRSKESERRASHQDELKPSRKRTVLRYLGSYLLRPTWHYAAKYNLATVWGSFWPPSPVFRECRFCIHFFIHPFLTSPESLSPRSSQVRSPGQVKWSYFQKYLRLRAVATVFKISIWNFQELIGASVPKKKRKSWNFHFKLSFKLIFECIILRKSEFWDSTWQDRRIY